MIPARTPQHRPSHAKLLVVDADGQIRHTPRRDLIDHLAPGDLVVANDAATIPASLHGTHLPSGAPIEVRLAGRPTGEREDPRQFVALVFGAGDHRTRTEDRLPPPRLYAGHGLSLGPLHATVLGLLDHPRLVTVRFTEQPAELWAGITGHGKPIQYAHVEQPLVPWDVWTSFASVPVAFEAPSAGFQIDWKFITDLRGRGIDFATLTHAAGISSTGDPALDARLPLDEAYTIPDSTVRAIEDTRARGGRVVAVGTTVTRALEHAAGLPDGLRSGAGVATQRIGPGTQLRIVDAIVSGAHAPDESHHELLRAFVDDGVLARVDAALDEHNFRSHEFGDSVFVARSRVDTPRTSDDVQAGYPNPRWIAGMLVASRYPAGQLR